MGCFVDRELPTRATPESEVAEAHVSLIKQRFGLVESLLPPAEKPLTIKYLDWTEEEDEAFVSLMCREPERVFRLETDELLKCLIALMKHVGVLRMLSKQSSETESFLIAFAQAHNQHPFSCLRNTVAICIGYVKMFNLGRSVLAKYLNQFDYCRGFLSCMAVNVAHRKL